MSKAIPAIQKFMTYQPISVENSTLIADAQSIMEKNNIRHLPIMDKDEIYGILSDRDIKQAMGLLGSDPKKVSVKDICQTHFYETTPETPIDHVTDEMAEHHYGCAVIVQNKKLVGIFTTVDACRTLSTIVQERFHS